MNPEQNSPGLQMDHGFLKRIERNQIFREQQARKEATIRHCDTAKLAKRVGVPATKQMKPAMEIYRPPSLRVSGDFGTKLDYVSSTYDVTIPSSVHLHEGALPWYPQMTTASSSAFTMVPVSVPIAAAMSVNYHHHHQQQQQQAMMHHHQPPPIGLSKSCSTTMAHRVHFQAEPQVHVPQPAVADKREPQAGYGLKRSKSLGSSDMRHLISADLDISTFSPKIQSIVRKAINDPNTLPARQLMEIVCHLFNRVLERVQYAEPVAKLCILIIERETTETFLESLLNSCMEWFNERHQRFNELTMSGPSSYGARQPPLLTRPSSWVAYVTFLYELYTRLKNRKQPPMPKSSASPATLILTLLSECCLLFMKPSSLEGFSEIECLFIVLTSIGRDLRNEHPQQMQLLMNAARDAFLAPSTPKSARKTLMQLIEMNASNWQLTASAVAYYYPGPLPRK